MNAFVQLLIANYKEVIRDRIAIFFFIAFPILFILIFGMIYSGAGQQSYDIGIVVEGQGAIETAIVDSFNFVPSFEVHEGGREDEIQALKEGKRSLVMVVPEETSRNVISGRAVDIPVYYDATRQLNSQVLIPVADQILMEIERGITNRPRLFVSKPQPVQASRLRDIDYLLPGVIAMALMQLGLFGSLRLVGLRERKILKGLGATPLPRTTFLLSEIIVRLSISLVQALLIVVVGRLAFDVQIVGSKLVVLGLVLLGAGTFVAMGYMLVSFVKTEESGNGLIQLVQFPMMFLSGIFFPIDFMPKFLRPVVNALPLTYLGDALRQVMVDAAPEYGLTTDVLVLGGWLIVSLIIAARFWKWE